MNADFVDALRLETDFKLNPKNKYELGQFMTPSIISDYMASLFTQKESECTLLDCGAGIGSLSISAINQLKNITSVDLWEIDSLMSKQLKINMEKIDVNYSIYKNDFIQDAVDNILLGKGNRYTHAIINPPYKKINSNSFHRKLLRKTGIETVNLYSAFLSLTIVLMKDHGEIVAIIPRSFCNGLYYKEFRKFLLKNCSIEHIHIFESRNSAFKDYGVLQENVIIKLIKNKRQGNVEISNSKDHTFSDYMVKDFEFNKIVKPDDSEIFIRIPKEFNQVENEKIFSVPLSELEINVSTGSVVDFRVKEYLQYDMEGEIAPLIYPHHFIKGKLFHPQQHKKHNAIKIVPESKKWLMPKDGFYVLVKRFSSKEEKRRVVAYIVDPKEIYQSWIGFENHWNVFHINKHGLDELVAKGLACFLNSTELDQHFRSFSGHTQVNATDLRNIKFPTLETLIELGKSYKTSMNQAQIDKILRGIL
ncbi:Eco57I restriction-modification methylase domain-containing protein [Neisseria dentiae]|uniref:Eco57I restriction-modification methylase domain-containing protein n=1 Tax=Neisseria dentiae TaxID=194197 RepID=UPI00211BD612|nr:Eco57I restriction-modification methylase domain-containing protein [Neisseria dentiae]MCQ9327573.1 Eco57I restriction-modification methylase domain-containing protein [Neisseria dentiae]